MFVYCLLAQNVQAGSVSRFFFYTLLKKSTLLWSKFVIKFYKYRQFSRNKISGKQTNIYLRQA